jgi:hypothetical protein
LGSSLLRPGGHLHPFMLADSSGTTGSPVPCQRLQRAHATFTPDTARTTYRPPPDSKRHNLRAFIPGQPSVPSFDVITKHFDASSVVHSRSSSRRTPDPLKAGLFRSRFPPRLLTGMTPRRFGIPACTANPEGQTSITNTARLATVTSYITATPLSGHTVSSRGHRSPRRSQNPA